MCRESGRRETSDDAINDPEVLWAVIEGLLTRVAALPDGAPDEADPIVLVVDGDTTYHRHPRCPLLTEPAEHSPEGGRVSGTARRLPRSAAARVGLTPCRACRGHRPARPGGPEGDG